MRDMVERRYKADWTNTANRRRYRQGRQRMLRRGYQAISAVTHRQPQDSYLRTILRIITFGLFTLLWPPKPVLVVTYRMRA